MLSSHRLSTITSADQILFIQGGRVIEKGIHQDLVNQGGRYAAMWNKQTKTAS